MKEDVKDLRRIHGTQSKLKSKMSHTLDGLFRSIISFCVVDELWHT